MTSIPSSLPLRNDLLGEEPYGAPQLDVPVCLNVNENPYPLDEEVAKSIAHCVGEVAQSLNRYPDREHVRLRQAFCDYLSVESDTRLSVDQLWGANGSNEIMLQIFQAFGGPGRTALGCDPTYSMYPEYARDTFTDWKVIHRNADFTINLEATLQGIADVKPSIVLLTSPNNPTGTNLPLSDVKTLLAQCEKTQVAGAREGTHPVLVIDEAYVEFRNPGTPSAVSLIPEHANLAVSRTMSKAFAFAGARVGYLAAERGIIDCLRIVRMPYHLSAITQAAALAAFEHTDLQLKRVAKLRRTRDETAQWLKQQHYHGKPLQVADSESNFLLFGTFDDRELVFNKLLERGILIRVVGPDHWLRVCMGTDEEMAKFRTAFAQVLSAIDN